MRYRAILFDMDGVLIESEALTAKVAVQTLREFGIEAKETDFAQFSGCGEDRYIGGVAEMYGVPYQKIMKARLYENYGKVVCDEVIVPPMLKETLTALRACGYKMAVCSAADREKVEWNLRAIGMGENFFDYVVTGSEVEHQKPAPDIYLNGAARLGMQPEECIVIEDAPAGIKAAHAAGITAVALCTTFKEDYLREQAQPDYIIPALKDLPALLEIL